MSSFYTSVRREHPLSRLPSRHRFRRPRRVSTCLAKVIGINFTICASLVAGCSQQQHRAAAPTPPVFRPPPPAVATGIVVEKWQPQSVIIGMIDPTTGDYTDYTTFAASVAKFDLNAEGPDYKLSEDFTKYSTVLHLPGGINHAGWVDRNGLVTDVNTNVPKLTAFGYASRTSMTLDSTAPGIIITRITTRIILLVPLRSSNYRAAPPKVDNRFAAEHLLGPGTALLTGSSTAMANCSSIALIAPLRVTGLLPTNTCRSKISAWKVQRTRNSSKPRCAAARGWPFFP